MSVLEKLRGLATWKKIALAVCVSSVLGIIMCLVFGPEVGGLAGFGGALSAMFGLAGGNQSLSDQARDLASRDRERAEQETEDVRAAVKAEMLERSKERGREAKALAHSAGADDGGDPNRLLDRHSSGDGTWPTRED